MAENALVVKYRPTSWDGILGNDLVVAGLQANIEDGTAHSFLLTGQSGCGKTTLARLAAAKLGCKPGDIRDVNAAMMTGIDSIRDLTAGLAYRPLSASAAQVFILDECHRLTGNAWDGLLKPLEEPPAWVYWFLCTTDPKKIPETVRTRCTTYQVQPCDDETLEVLLDVIVEEEGMKPAKGILALCAAEAGGSPRQAIAYLSACHRADSVAEAATLLETARESSEAIEFARLMVKGADHKAVMELLKKLAGTNPESIRLVLVNYVSKVALGARDQKTFIRAAELLDFFKDPCYGSEGMAPLIRGVAHFLFSK